MDEDKNTTYHWTNLFGKPEKVKKVSYIDDYGRWDEEYYRADGSFMYMKPSPLELHKTKKEAIRSSNYFKNVRKAISKVKY